MLWNFELITLSALIHCDFFPLLYKSAVLELFRKIHYLFGMVSDSKCNIFCFLIQNLEYLTVLLIIKLCKLLAVNLFGDQLNIFSLLPILWHNFAC